MKDLNQIEREQFDTLHGTNTAAPLARIAFRRLQNLNQGSAYQASWTSTINRNYQWCRDYLGDRFAAHTFIDIGAGKGKVNLIWQQNLDRDQITQRNMGIEYYEPLVTIARNNFKIMFQRPGEFVVADAATANLRTYGDQLIIYMFNPFNTLILLQMLRNLRGWPTLLIYNVPAAETLLTTQGFQVVERFSGPNQNQCTTFFERS
jgi:hypothetical protein